jgi:hypothetical protein
MRLGIIAAVMAALALLCTGAALADTFSAGTVTLTSKTAKPGMLKGPPGVVCFTCDGSGYAACGSAWVDKHDDTFTGSYGIHGSVSWCWNGSSVWNVDWGLGAWSNNRYSVIGYSHWGSGAECGGGAGLYSYASYRWEPLPEAYVNFNYSASTSVCPGGWGVIR